MINHYSKFFTFFITLIFLSGNSGHASVIENYVSIDDDLEHIYSDSTNSENSNYFAIYSYNTIANYISILPEVSRVNDNTSLSATISACPNDISVNVDSGRCDAVVTFAALPTTDIPNYSMVLTSTLGSGSTFPIGETTVTYVETANNGTDPDGDTCTFTVTVTDNEPPIITLIGAATITLEACTDAYTELGANTTDNCTVGTVTVGGDTVDANTPGIYTVTYNATDTNGVAADEVTRIITVSDTTKPVINLIGAATITLEACSGTYTELGANATDNCSVGALTVGGDTVDANTPGIYTVTYNVTDTNGVAADEVTRVVTVNDTTKPVINLNGAATITLEACSDTYTELGANATDNCSVGAVTVGGDTVDANTPGIYTVT
ncbi:immunoglobulin-like domain-containing protein, partial [Winogradskyella bathintestinalis]